MRKTLKKRMKQFTALALIPFVLSGCGGCGKKEPEKKIANDFRENVVLARNIIESANIEIDTALSQNEAVKKQGVDFFKNGFFDGMKLFDYIDEELFNHIEFLNEDTTSFAEAQENVVSSYGKNMKGKIDVKRNAEDDYTISYSASENPYWVTNPVKVETAINCVYDANHGWSKVIVTKTASGETVESGMFELFRDGDVYILQTDNERLWIEFEKNVDEKTQKTTWTVKKFTYSKLEQGRIPDPEVIKEETEKVKRILEDIERKNKAKESTETETATPSSAVPSSEAPSAASSVTENTQPESQASEGMVPDIKPEREFNRNIIIESLGMPTVYGFSGTGHYSSKDSVFTTYKNESEWPAEYRDKCAIIIEYEDGNFVCYNRNKINYRVEKWVVKDNEAICIWGDDMSKLTSTELSQVEEEIASKHKEEESSSSSS